MPNFPAAAAVKETKRASIAFKDSAGKVTNVGLDDLPIDATTVNIQAWIGSMGDMSNAGISKHVVAEQNQIAEGNIQAYDEAESSVTARANFTFQDDLLETRTFTVPAPDLSIFDSTGLAVNPANTLVSGYINAALAVLNAGTVAGTYQFIRGVRSDVARGARRVPSRPNTAEPSGGVNPPALPGA
jgi:hypothetical protein